MPKVSEVIRKENGKWYLYTADGLRRLGGPYTSRDAAGRREKQVQFFKHQKEVGMPKKVSKEKGVAVPEGYKPKGAMVTRLYKALGVKEAGDTQQLIDTFGDWANGSVTTCMSKLEGKEGIEDPATLCAWMKDQWSGSAEWRGEEKVGEMYDGASAYAEPAVYWVPSNITSFADLQKHNEALEVAEELQSLNKQFMCLINNVLYSSEEDKVGALYSLVYEFSSAIPEELSTRTGAGEAATVKAAVKAAAKALDSLLGDKALPKSVLAQVKALRETFKKTWKDLEVEAADEPSEEVEPEPEVGSDAPQPEKISESFDGEITVAEGAITEPSAIELDVVLIKPGWGNTRDNHFYPRSLLTDQAMMEKFVGSKMYESDHRPGEKSTRTWVSTITGIKGFTSEGSPIARVAVHDPNFAERIINLQSKNLLGKMECSILADAVAERKVYEEGGRKGKKILEITNVESVDWVTRAGAGGHVLRVAEGEEGTQEPEEEGTQAQTEGVQETQPQENQDDVGGTVMPLTSEQVKVTLGKSRLPQVSQERLVEASYEDEAALEAAITSEVEYLKVVTSSGKPFSVGESQSPEPERISEAEVVKKLDAIDQHFGIKP